MVSATIILPLGGGSTRIHWDGAEEKIYMLSSTTARPIRPTRLGPNRSRNRRPSAKRHPVWVRTSTLGLVLLDASRRRSRRLTRHRKLLRWCWTSPLKVRKRKPLKWWPKRPRSRRKVFETGAFL